MKYPLSPPNSERDLSFRPPAEPVREDASRIVNRVLREEVLGRIASDREAFFVQLVNRGDECYVVWSRLGAARGTPEAEAAFEMYVLLAKDADLRGTTIPVVDWPTAEEVLVLNPEKLSEWRDGITAHDEVAASFLADLASDPELDAATQMYIAARAGSVTST